MPSQSRHPTRALLSVVTVGSLLSGCAGFGGMGEDSDAINVLMVNNPQMADLQKLTARHFTKETGIKVNFTVLPENEVRDKISQDFSNQAGQYDVATLSNYETPIYADNGWLRTLDPYMAKDGKFDRQDVLSPIRKSLRGEDGDTYATPFYGESSFLMYRKDIFRDLGLQMPENPTWRQVAALAKKAEGARKGMAGICLRGLPGWGELIAPLTSVVNTMGGTWFDRNWEAKLDSGGFAKATRFYVELVRKHGESGAAQSGYAECLNNMTQGNAAMWYDATAGAGSLEATKSPVKGKIGYVPAPVARTDSSGWLYTWAWAMQKASDKPDKAWKFISWASGKKYERLVGRKMGWSNVPAGKRESTYRNPEYQQAASSFHEVTHDAISNTKPNDPGVQKRPTPGIQFVGIPEFTELGLEVSQEISAAIAGQQSVDEALATSQELAEEVAEEYQK